jgi:general secretion pathway protein H
MTKTSRTGTSTDGPSPGAADPLRERPRGTERAGGFTLLELMVVLFIVSLMAALVLPNLRYSENRIRSQARKVASILRYLNETAAAKKVTLPISFNIDKGTITWQDSEGERSEEIDSLSAVELQSRGILKEGELVVFFQPLGLREYLMVYLRQDDEERTVAFNPVSGRVKIIEPEK